MRETRRRRMRSTIKGKKSKKKVTASCIQTQVSISFTTKEHLKSMITTKRTLNAAATKGRRIKRPKRSSDKVLGRKNYR